MKAPSASHHCAAIAANLEISAASTVLADAAAVSVAAAAPPTLWPRSFPSLPSTPANPLVCASRAAASTPATRLSLTRPPRAATAAPAAALATAADADDNAAAAVRAPSHMAAKAAPRRLDPNGPFAPPPPPSLPATHAARRQHRLVCEVWCGRAVHVHVKKANKTKRSMWPAHATLQARQEPALGARAMRAAQPQLRLRARAPPSRLVRAPRAAGGALASVCRRRAALASCDWTPTEPCCGACRRRAALAKAAVLAAAAALGTTPGRADAQPGLQEGGARTSSGKALLPDPDFDPNASALVQSLRTRTEQNKVSARTMCALVRFRALAIAHRGCAPSRRGPSAPPDPCICLGVATLFPKAYNDQKVQSITRRARLRQRHRQMCPPPSHHPPPPNTRHPTPIPPRADTPRTSPRTPAPRPCSDWTISTNATIGCFLIHVTRGLRSAWSPRASPNNSTLSMSSSTAGSFRSRVSLKFGPFMLQSNRPSIRLSMLKALARAPCGLWPLQPTRCCVAS